MKKGEYCIKQKNNLLVVTIICFSFLLPTIHAGMNLSESGDEGYLIDQIQDQFGGWYSAIDNDGSAAQSFTPMMTPLAKLRLYMKANNPNNPSEDYPVKISIRDSLDGSDLTSVTLNKQSFFDELTWVNIDFDDITVEIGSTYYIVVESLSTGGEYWWGMYSSLDVDKYEAGEAWITESDQGPVRWVNFTDRSDFCFKTYAYQGRESDLHCSGLIGLPNQKPGGSVTTEFNIENCGDAQSLLNWEIVSYPEWGSWTFESMHGFDLQPADGTLSVEVTIDVPDEKNAAFDGEIIIANMDNSSDIGQISVTLTTPKQKQQSFSMISYLHQYILDFLNKQRYHGVFF